MRRILIGVAAAAALFSGLVAPATAQGSTWIAVNPGCNGTHLPMGMFRSADPAFWTDSQHTACQKCDDRSYYWRHFGMRTWCWQTSSDSAELWLFAQARSAD